VLATEAMAEQDRQEGRAVKEATDLDLMLVTTTAVRTSKTMAQMVAVVVMPVTGVKADMAVVAQVVPQSGF